MRHQDTAAQVMDLFLQKGATDVAVMLDQEDSTQIKFANNKVSTTQTWDSFDMRMFVAIGKKTIVTSMHDFSAQAVQDAADRLMKFAKDAPDNPEYEGIARGPFEYVQPENVYDDIIARASFDATDYVEKGINTALSNGATRTAGIFETSVKSRYLLTSQNVEAETKSTRAYFSLRAFAERDASGHYVSNSTHLANCDVEKTAADAAHVAVQAKNPVAGTAGKFDILFEPLAASNIIERVGHCASAFAVESGLSCFADKIGKPVASHAFNLIDDPTLAGSLGSIPFDEEGVPTQKNTLIENGVLKTYLHNTSSAKRYGTVTTANAGLIEPEPHSIVVEKGNLNKAQLFDQIQRGLWITNVWYTRFQNYESGDFSTIPRDGIFLIEDGRVTKSLKDIRISENLLNMLGNVAAVGDDVEQVMGWEVETPVTTPSILVKDVRVTRSVE